LTKKRHHGISDEHLIIGVLRYIFYVGYGESGLDLITPEVDLERNDGSNRKWRLDFAIKNQKQ
jgi:hypothetical protein